MTSKIRLSTRIKRTPLKSIKENLIVRFISDSDVEKIITGVELILPEESAEKSIKLKKNTSKATKTQSNNKKKVRETPVESSEESDDDNDLHEISEKPRGLCDEEDVAGDKIYQFRTPKKHHGMLQKAKDSASKSRVDSGTPKKTRTPSRTNTPVQVTTPVQRRTPRRQSLVVSRKQTPSKDVATPRNSQKETAAPIAMIPKTPYHLRNRQKAAIQSHKRKLEACGSDSDWSDSDYHSSSSESGGSDEESDEKASGSDSGKGSEKARPSCRRSITFQHPPVASTRKKEKDLNYVFTADEYFHSRAGKCVTSDRRLSRLQNPRLDTAELRLLLRNCSVTPLHQQALGRLRQGDHAMFQRWMFALSQGFSVLAYGLGSKHNILHRFHREMLPDSHVLVVNGFFPSLNIKEVVDAVAQDLLGLNQSLPSPHATIDWIESRRSMPRVFLIVHNLDAEVLRSEKTQQILSRLASLPRVHLVASVDHINCPLLWDQAKLSSFNFMWEDMTSFLPYQEETSFETSLMVQNSGSLVLTSLLNVYRSLTHNSQGVFRIILEAHLQENNQKYTGMAFSELYSRCREEMLVTSDLALRTMLTEFLDHQMVKWRRDEHLYIPTPISTLTQFHKLIQDS